ncbi:uncharacterized protein KQ657_000900 [Scheffersomyces spartinae]|uniref:Uncharacterized protein n=1 Tax=Scheffersomyces spartinae TaxID=45513 RepID=A0A9P7V8B9_9ASCO|nr:uncharacterized protein KQ657_000900 [Scheffersomyces spartinae]KAG7193146.1 hypothetical protein KQ657_000900 [Scheffersomyces spartinae]
MTIFDDSIPEEENVVRRRVHFSETLARQITDTFLNAMEEWFSKNSEQLRISRIVPERPNFFHSQFPRKSSNLDTEYHYSHFDAGTLARFFPELVLRIIVPALYLHDMKRKKLHLLTKGVPTMEELSKCQSLEGVGFWNRSGTWFCTRGYDQAKLRLTDEFGPRYFTSYNEWLNWDREIAREIYDAKENSDWDTVKLLRGLSN